MIYIIITTVCVIVLIALIIFLIQGPPYVPLRDKPAADMLSLVQQQHPTHILDMGSGDGKLVILMASHGYTVDGVELNPWLVYKSRRAIKRAGLQGKATIYWGNFWKFDVKKYDMIMLYLTQHIMKQVGEKLMSEAQPGTYVASHFFTFPQIKVIRHKGDARLYQIT